LKRQSALAVDSAAKSMEGKKNKVFYATTVRFQEKRGEGGGGAYGGSIRKKREKRGKRKEGFISFSIFRTIDKGGKRSKKKKEKSLLGVDVV